MVSRLGVFSIHIMNRGNTMSGGGLKKKKFCPPPPCCWFTRQHTSMLGWYGPVKSSLLPMLHGRYGGCYRGSQYSILQGRASQTTDIWRMQSPYVHEDVAVKMKSSRPITRVSTRFILHIAAVFLQIKRIARRFPLKPDNLWDFILGHATKEHEVMVPCHISPPTIITKWDTNRIQA